MSAAPKLPPEGVALARDFFRARTPRDAFVLLLAKGFWPIAVYPKGATRADRVPCEGKEPIGKAWGLERWTLEKANDTYKRYREAGVGICLGPERAPGGGWLIDVEGDGPEADDSRAWLFDSQVAESPGWASARGGHMLLIADPQRLARIMPLLKELEGKEKARTGVYKSDKIPGLELRIGGYKSEGIIKQVQSVVPPTKGTDGKSRIWTGPAEIAHAPDSFYAKLESLAPKPKAAASFAGNAKGPRVVIAEGTGRDDNSTGYVSAYVRKAVSDEAARVSSASEGNRHLTLIAVTMNLAGFVKAGDLPADVYRRVLGDAARECGLPDGEASDAIESALEKSEARDMTRAKAWRPEGDKEAQEKENGQESGKAKVDDNPGTQESTRKKANSNEKRMRFSNYHLEKSVGSSGKSEWTPIPNTVQEIDQGLTSICPGWPKRVQETLFIGTPEDEPVYLNSSTRLFAWVDRQAQVDWTKGGRYITQERFFEHKRMTSERFEAIEIMPHTPSLPGIYYMHRDLPEPSDKLERLLDFFVPATPIDRQLLKSMIATPSWGSLPGHRPGFMVTGPDRDPQQGRGLGKTTIVDVISDQIYGGYIDVSPTDDISDVKTRLLSDDSTIKRIVRLDNVKTLRFSWADLEGLMTASEISGRALYKGEGRRPNTIVWMITLNGASLSKDMAQRVIPVKLNRPIFRAGWVEEVKAFASDYRWEILADIAHFLRLPAGQLKAKTRWASWERDILSKLQGAEECQSEIIERQGKADDDNSERDHVRDYFAKQILDRDRDPESTCIFIPSLIAAEWLSEATRTHFATNRSSAHIKGLSISELVQTRESTRRGFIWRGKDCTDANPIDLKEVESDNNANFGPSPTKRRTAEPRYKDKTNW